MKNKTTHMTCIFLKSFCHEEMPIKTDIQYVYLLFYLEPVKQ